MALIRLSSETVEGEPSRKADRQTSQNPRERNPTRFFGCHHRLRLPAQKLKSLRTSCAQAVDDLQRNRKPFLLHSMNDELNRMPHEAEDAARSREEPVRPNERTANLGRALSPHKTAWTPMLIAIRAFLHLANQRRNQGEHRIKHCTVLAAPSRARPGDSPSCLMTVPTALPRAHQSARDYSTP
ncbi:hypothetical protein J0A71_11g24480 [Encephalitozoon cuniculi]|nr:hypothetical protein J0A71_01g00070 [Encephalitozoon cuniculi]UYI26434.1 hypothetical protein J0A71_01g02540 [Encephalitozoon cuniculi]UYI26447.1 hypothetical protein J0A71_02g02720 [Encephalitozoon cuniculi]UYI26659.1 hypothetical protein J0A71_02g04900 [Encephalitozoon cuniculi]UYI26905.1 hypothetical protein J0A71_03g07450 [Encephalitozoon cuniculi]